MTGFVAVWLASLAGSVHCVAMCGGFATVAMAGASSPRVGRIAAYHGARGAGYLVLGATAGLAGSAVDGLGLSVLGLPRVAAWIMGALLIGMGLASLRPQRPAPLTLRTGPGLGTRLRRVLAPLLRGQGTAAAAAIGGLSALLPCGWLWGYVILASSTGDPLAGATTMAAFWLGTVPGLAVVGLASGKVLARLGPHAPKLTAGAMILIGLLTLTGKFQILPGAPAEDGPACHEGP